MLPWVTTGEHLPPAHLMESCLYTGGGCLPQSTKILWLITVAAEILMQRFMFGFGFLILSLIVCCFFFFFCVEKGVLAFCWIAAITCFCNLNLYDVLPKQLWICMHLSCSSLTEVLPVTMQAVWKKISLKAHFALMMLNSKLLMKSFILTRKTEEKKRKKTLQSKESQWDS